MFDCSYGPSALGGFAAVWLLKRTVEAVPIVRAVISPILGEFTANEQAYMLLRSNHPLISLQQLGFNATGIKYVHPSSTPSSH